MEKEYKKISASSNTRKIKSTGYPVYIIFNVRGGVGEGGVSISRLVQNELYALVLLY